jgi:hypothetical protein
MEREIFEYIIDRERVYEVIVFKSFYESRLKRRGQKKTKKKNTTQRIEEELTSQKNPKRQFKTSKIQISYANDNLKHVLCIDRLRKQY